MSELTTKGQQRVQELLERANKPEEELFRGMKNLLTDVYTKEWKDKSYADSAPYSGLFIADNILKNYERFVSEDERKNSTADLRGIAFRTAVALSQLVQDITIGKIHENEILQKSKIEADIITITTTLDLIDKYNPQA